MTSAHNNSTSSQKYTSVTFIKNLGTSNVNYGSGWKRNNPGTMTLYSGVENDGAYTVNEMEIVAAHEFGHILGIRDGYNHPLTKNIDSIMCNPFGSNRSTRSATNTDITMALNAFKTNKQQKWFVWS